MARRRGASHKDRSHDGDVGQMRAAAEGIVEHRDVAGREPQLGDGGAHRHRHGAQMHGHVIAHGEHVAGRVKERAGVIATLLDVGRERGAAQRCAHLFGHRVKEMLEDFELDRIGAHTSECNSRVSGAKLLAHAEP